MNKVKHPKVKTLNIDYLLIAFNNQLNILSHNWKLKLKVTYFLINIYVYIDLENENFWEVESLITKASTILSNKDK